jgi:ribosomal protein S13
MELCSVISESGRDALEEIPGIGSSIAGVIDELCNTGKAHIRHRLEEQLDPAAAIRDLPGIGETLGDRVVSELDVQSLEDLELAAHDGRLASVEGFGSDKVRAIQDMLAARLSQSGAPRPRADERGGSRAGQAEPSTELLLEVDREYREKAERGELQTIAPKRFNPESKAWLPVYDVEKEGWSFTALFSNTARAHEEGKTRDWVVIYWERTDSDEDKQSKGQNTVVTSRRGGDRVVSGRG